MGRWNHRVIKHPDGTHEIVEAQYDAEGFITAWKRTGVVGNDWEDLRGEVDGMLRAVLACPPGQDGYRHMVIPEGELKGFRGIPAKEPKGGTGDI